MEYEPTKKLCDIHFNACTLELYFMCGADNSNNFIKITKINEGMQKNHMDINV